MIAAGRKKGRAHVAARQQSADEEDDAEQDVQAVLRRGDFESAADHFPQARLGGVGRNVNGV